MGTYFSKGLEKYQKTAAFLKVAKELFISCLVTRNEPKKHTGSNAAGGFMLILLKSTNWFIGIC
jgi:hypothetical protein